MFEPAQASALTKASPLGRSVRSTGTGKAQTSTWPTALASAACSRMPLQALR